MEKLKRYADLQRGEVDALFEYHRLNLCHGDDRQHSIDVLVELIPNVSEDVLRRIVDDIFAAVTEEQWRAQGGGRYE